MKNPAILAVVVVVGRAFGRCHFGVARCVPFLKVVHLPDWVHLFPDPWVAAWLLLLVPFALALPGAHGSNQHRPGCSASPFLAPVAVSWRKQPHGRGTCQFGCPDRLGVRHLLAAAGIVLLAVAAIRSVRSRQVTPRRS